MGIFDSNSESGAAENVSSTNSNQALNDFYGQNIVTNSGPRLNFAAGDDVEHVNTNIVYTDYGAISAGLGIARESLARNETATVNALNFGNEVIGRAQNLSESAVDIVDRNASDVLNSIGGLLGYAERATSDALDFAADSSAAGVTRSNERIALWTVAAVVVAPLILEQVKKRA